MNDRSQNLEKVLGITSRKAHLPDLPSGLKDDIMRSVRNLPGGNSDNVLFEGAMWTGGIAVAAALVMFMSGGLNLGLGLEWFADPLGLATIFLFGA